MQKASAALILTAVLQLIPFRGPVLADQHGSASGTVYLLDRETTYRLYRQAAEQGDAAAQALVGGMYLVGEGVPRDFAEAAKWYRKAAEQGNADAQYDLGVMYADGQGVPRDYVFAYMLFDLAATSFEAANSRDIAAKDRDVVASKATPAQIAEARRLAREWKSKMGK